LIEGLIGDLDESARASISIDQALGVSARDDQRSDPNQWLRQAANTREPVDISPRPEPTHAGIERKADIRVGRSDANVLNKVLMALASLAGIADSHRLMCQHVAAMRTRTVGHGRGSDVLMQFLWPERWLGLLVCALALAAGPTSAAAETLNQALSRAYKTNPRLDAERARLRATDEEVARAISGYRPTISGTADYAYQNTETKPPSSTNGKSDPHGYSFTAVQPVFRGFRTTNQLREAEATVRAGRETLRNVEQIVLLETVTAFMDVVRDQAIVGLRENNVSVLSRELKATQDRFAVGEVTRTDVAQAQARRAGAVSALDLARANLRTSRAAFERVVGGPPTNLREPTMPRRLLPRSLEEARAIGGKENPNVIASLYREQAARHTVDKVWGELLPTVQVEANYTKRYDSNPRLDESETTTVTGRVNVPIYEGGEVRARVRQSKHTHVSRLQEIEQARTETVAGVTGAWSALQASLAQLESDEVQVQSTRIALNGVREEEKVGQRTILDVLNAEQEYLNAQVSLVTTKRNLIVNSYSVLSQIGKLNIETLGVSDTVYDPEEHYHEARRKWFSVSITHRDGRREEVDFWSTHGDRR
jgi:outer membrane protein